MNLLKTYRKKSRLTQDDIAYILNKQKVSISRYEKGKRIAPLSILMLYKIIFNVTLKDLFRVRHRNLKFQIHKRSQALIEKLQKEVQSPRVQERIESLQNIVESIGCLKDISQHDENRRT